MEVHERFSQQWERMIYRDDLGYKTVSIEIEEVPLLVVYHERTLRFRVFIQGEFSRFDVTPIIGKETHAKCFEFLSNLKPC